ncbi:SMC-Scp complex subunit ScpB [Nocardia iowensis]
MRDIADTAVSDTTVGEHPEDAPLPSAAPAPDQPECPEASASSLTADVDDLSADADAPTSSADAPTPGTDAPNPTTYDATPVADNTVSEFTPEPLDDDEFRSALEAMLLVVDAPAPVEQLAAALDDTTERVDEVLRQLSAELSARGSGIDLRFVGDGWRFYTRSEYAPYVERVLLDGARTKLTRAALETLAVVAYRQPVTRTRVSAVRGVNVDGVMRTLLARGLIAEAGVDPETNGTMYCTTELFLERIGLASLTDLPPLAPLLPGVDLIDEINESLDTDPRYTRLKKPAEADLDLGSED